MTIGSSTSNTVIVEKQTGGVQMQLLVDNCNVVLNFPSKSESTIINDIKRMMLGGAVKI